MAPSNVRSRACNECRRRRVKCDETASYCKQCLRLGLLCSGPIEGVLILDMTSKVSEKGKKARKVKKKKDDEETITTKGEARESEVISSSSKSSSNCSRKPSDSVDLALRPSKPLQRASSLQSDSNISTSNCLDHELSNLLRSPKADASEEMLISRFVDLIASQRPYVRINDQSWLYQLPAISARTQLPVLKYSIRAAAMAHCGFTYKDENIKTESYRWYVAGLESQRQLLAGFAHGDKTSESNENREILPDYENICVPLMLSVFELVARTTPCGWVQHVMASVSLMEMRGPQRCQTGLEAEMFRSTRVFSAFVSVLRNSPSSFANEEWLRIPFESSKRSPWEKLIDLLLTIPKCMALFDYSDQCCSLEELLHTVQQNALPDSYIYNAFSDLLLKLESWWWEYEKYGISLDVQPQQHTQNLNPCMSKTPTTYFPRIFVYRDTLTAKTISVYNAACLIVNAFLHATSTSLSLADGIGDHERRMMSHTESILSVAAFQESQTQNYGDIVRTVFPLRVVTILGSSLEQKKLAWEIIQRWTIEKGLNGEFGDHDGTYGEELQPSVITEL